MSFSPLILRSQAGSRSAHPGRPAARASAFSTLAAACAAEAGIPRCGRGLAEGPALALDARDGADDRSRESAIDHLGVALRLRCERSQWLGRSALKEPPNSCKDASLDAGYTVHDISRSTPPNVRVPRSPIAHPTPTGRSRFRT